MLDNDPRYLRPKSRIEMDRRIQSLTMSPTRRSRGRLTSRHHAVPPRHGPKEVHRSTPHKPLSRPLLTVTKQENSILSWSKVDSPAAQAIGTDDIPAHDISTSLGFLNLSYSHLPSEAQRQDNVTIPLEPASPTSLEMVQEVKRRLSDCSSHHALQLCTLIRDYTISDFSDEEQSVGQPKSATMLDETPDVGYFHDFTSGTGVYETFPDPGFALPGDFLTAHTRSCAHFPGQQHGKNCWCTIAMETSVVDNSWLLPTGELSGRALHVLAHFSVPGAASLHDGFGNTSLHLFAALEGYHEVLLCMVGNQEGGDLRAVNTAGQTFLHVLHYEWFVDVANPSALLWRLLTLVNDSCPELVYQADAYGRSFFHRAHSLIRDPATLSCLTCSFNHALAARRDAFGFNPVPPADLADQRHYTVYTPPRRLGSFWPSAEGLSGSASPASRPHSCTTDGCCVLAYHARLVQTIQSAYTNPAVEDDEGRNGLHCLAEAILDQDTMDRLVQGSGLPRTSSSSSFSSSASTATAHSTSTTSIARPRLKRELSSSTTDLPPSSTPPTSTPSSTATIPPAAQEEEIMLPTRLRHLNSLLSPSISVSPHHYSRRGHTPLMAFIQHIPDEQDGKARTLQTILETLIRRGGPRAVEARNGRGETPLLMAARLGRKVALSALLRAGGANVAARDADGRGVLELLDAEVRAAGTRDDVALYARLEACRALLTGREEWGVRYVDDVDPACVAAGSPGAEWGWSPTRGMGLGDVMGQGLQEAAVVREWKLRDGHQGWYE